MDELLLSLFENTRLNDKQRRVYLALLQLGSASVSRIAQEAGIKRPNAYTIIEELEAMGYARQIAGSSRKIYAATDPSKVASELKRASKSFEEMLPYLRAIQKRSGKPYAQYYNGLEGVKQAFSQIYRPKDARYLTSIARNMIAIPEEVARWQKGYLLGGTRPGGRHILTDTQADRAFATTLEKARQHTKYLNPEVSLNVDVALVDDTVFLTSFEDGVHTTVIKSKAICDALSALYDLAWQVLAID